MLELVLLHHVHHDLPFRGLHGRSARSVGLLSISQYTEANLLQIENCHLRRLACVRDHVALLVTGVLTPGSQLSVPVLLDVVLSEELLELLGICVSLDGAESHLGDRCGEDVNGVLGALQVRVEDLVLLWVGLQSLGEVLDERLRGLVAVVRVVGRLVRPACVHSVVSARTMSIPMLLTNNEDAERGVIDLGAVVNPANPFGPMDNDRRRSESLPFAASGVLKRCSKASQVGVGGDTKDLSEVSDHCDFCCEECSSGLE